MSEPRYGDYCGFCKQKPCKCQEKYLANMDELMKNFKNESMKNFKVTTPKQMASDLSELERALIDFEVQFKDQLKDCTYYHLVIIGELNRAVCKEIQRLYLEAGWKTAVCKTSSENGERQGLTGLVLTTK